MGDNNNNTYSNSEGSGDSREDDGVRHMHEDDTTTTSPPSHGWSSDEKENISPICQCCGKSFANQSNLRHHIEVIHNKTNKWRCTLCGKVCSSKSNLKVHFRVHVRVKVYYCKFCEYSCMHHSSIRDHLTKTHPDKQHSTLEPGYNFNAQAVPEPDQFNAVDFDPIEFVKQSNNTRHTLTPQNEIVTPRQLISPVAKKRKSDSNLVSRPKQQHAPLSFNQPPVPQQQFRRDAPTNQTYPFLPFPGFGLAYSPFALYSGLVPSSFLPMFNAVAEGSHTTTNTTTTTTTPSTIETHSTIVTTPSSNRSLRVSNSLKSSSPPVPKAAHQSHLQPTSSSAFIPYTYSVDGLLNLTIGSKASTSNDATTSSSTSPKKRRREKSIDKNLDEENDENKSSYPCHHCRLSFFDKQTFQLHSRLHTSNDNPWKCRICGEETKNDKEFLIHILKYNYHSLNKND
ncbi:unnamed protein product [Didymodactylos carnosus]|uniref:C2H2-type domain-containing protein n=1 Tax=Didymodactylos carnosus TaxID=1234261 RepID=A0A814B7Y4_9BILA|nr:unnamed protein product [Didymodactylos carnosus]CAF3702117.1 unnamed protein product [Didymodactylos carnosus]